jgi:hypothetical protein
MSGPEGAIASCSKQPSKEEGSLLLCIMQRGASGYLAPAGFPKHAPDAHPACCYAEIAFVPFGCVSTLQ